MARAGKTPWLAWDFGTYDGRSATEATGEPSASERGSGGSEMLDRRWLAGFYRAGVWGQGNRIFRERHKYCGDSLKGKRAAVAARQFACVTEDDL